MCLGNLQFCIEIYRYSYIYLWILWMYICESNIMLYSFLVFIFVNLVN